LILGQTNGSIHAITDEGNDSQNVATFVTEKPILAVSSGNETFLL